MPPGGRGNSVAYGKIVLSSEIESMDSIVKHLGDILQQHGYPNDSAIKTKEDEAREKDLEAAEKKLKELMAGGNANGPENP